MKREKFKEILFKSIHKSELQDYKIHLDLERDNYAREKILW